MDRPRTLSIALTVLLVLTLLYVGVRLAAFYHGGHLLYTPALTGDSAAARRLLALGANPNHPRKSHTPLQIAARLGNADVVRVLLDHGARVNAPTAGRKTPLHMAAEEGDEATVALLLDAGADLNARTARGETPLMIAAGDGHLRVVRLLLDRGADASLHARYGRTALSRTEDGRAVKRGSSTPKRQAEIGQLLRQAAKKRGGAQGAAGLAE